jgi:dephospho-CoA kinase
VKVIGITGNFGTGKSYVASLFRALGARVIDADRIAHEVIRRGRGEYAKAVAVFGREILDKKRNIDRKKLAGAVFSDKEKLKALNSIIHPAVIEYIRKRIRRSGGERRMIVIDAPLLIEAGLAGMVDSLIVVKCPRREQIKRCMRKFKMKKGEVFKRIKNQMKMSEKIKLADFVIDNGGTKAGTKRQVLGIERKLEMNKGGIWR